MKSNHYSRYFPANQENAAGFPANFEKKKRENLPLPFASYSYSSSTITLAATTTNTKATG